MDVIEICQSKGISGNFSEIKPDAVSKFTKLEDLAIAIELLNNLQDAYEQFKTLGEKLNSEGKVSQIYLKHYEKNKSKFTSPIDLLNEVLFLTLREIESTPSKNRDSLVVIEKDFIEQMYRAASGAAELFHLVESKLSPEASKVFKKVVASSNAKNMPALIAATDTLVTSLALNLDQKIKDQLKLSGKVLYPKLDELNALIRRECVDLIPAIVSPPQDQRTIQVVRVVPPVEASETKTEYDFALRLGGGWNQRFATSNLFVLPDYKQGGIVRGGGSLAITLNSRHRIGLDADFSGSNDFQGKDNSTTGTDSGWFSYAYTAAADKILFKVGILSSTHNYSTELYPMTQIGVTEFSAYTHDFNWGAFFMSQEFMGGKIQQFDDKAQRKQFSTSLSSGIAVKAGKTEAVSIGGAVSYGLINDLPGGGGFVGLNGNHSYHNYAFLGQYTREPSSKGSFNRITAGARYGFGPKENPYFGARAGYTYEDFNNAQTHRLDFTAAGNLPLGKGFSISPAINLTAGNALGKNLFGLGGFVNIIYTFGKPTPLLITDPLNPADLSPLPEVYHGR